MTPHDDNFINSMNGAEWEGIPLYTSILHFTIAEALVNGSTGSTHEKAFAPFYAYATPPDEVAALYSRLRRNPDAVHIEAIEFADGHNLTPGSERLISLIEKINEVTDQVLESRDDPETDDDEPEGMPGKSHSSPAMP